MQYECRAENKGPQEVKDTTSYSLGTDKSSLNATKSKVQNTKHLNSKIEVCVYPNRNPNDFFTAVYEF